MYFIVELKFTVVWSECVEKHIFASVETLIDYNYRISTDIFTVELKEGNRNGFFLRRAPGHVIIVCPPHADFRSRERQLMLGKAIVEAMRDEVKRTVVPRLQNFSKQTGIDYRRSFVRQSHTNWGSCSSNGNINLSVFLMALPLKFIDYVLLHELCHRIEMNHGPGFWTLLDSYTDGKAKLLRKGMNEYARKISPLLLPLVVATR